MAKQTMTGRCMCGAVRFEAREVDPHVHACHCGMCRHWSGGPSFALLVGSVTFSGEENVTAYASSEWAERAFCRLCGTHLFYRMKQDGTYAIWSGALDDVSKLELGGEIYIDDKPDFYDFAGEHPRLTGAEFLESMGMGE